MGKGPDGARRTRRVYRVGPPPARTRSDCSWRLTASSRPRSSWHSGNRSPMMLMDGADLYAVLDERIDLRELLRRKRREYADDGPRLADGVRDPVGWLGAPIRTKEPSLTRLMAGGRFLATQVRAIQMAGISVQAQSADCPHRVIGALRGRDHSPALLAPRDTRAALGFGGAACGRPRYRRVGVLAGRAAAPAKHRW